MSKVTKFPDKVPPKPARIWVCNCGCSTFELLETGETRCSLCDVVTAHNGGWLNLSPDQEWDGDSPMKDIRGNGEVPFVKSLMKSRIDDENAALIAVLEKGGRLHAWSSAETKEQSNWALEELKRVDEMIGALHKDLPDA